MVEFMDNSNAQSSTPSAIPTFTVSFTQPNETPLVDTNQITSNNAESTNIGFVDTPPLPLTKSEEKSNFVESNRQTDDINSMPSEPPITIHSESSDSEIPAQEMKSLKLLLRRAKSAVNYSDSKELEKCRLTASLERMWSFINKNRWRMSQEQANSVNEELKSIMSSRGSARIMKTGYLYSFIILIMILRFALDVFSIITISSPDLMKAVTFYLLAVNVFGSFFTGLIILLYWMKVRITIFETYFCIIWTMLYGIVTTLVILHRPDIPPEIMICGYTSMVTCILQGFLRLYDNKKSMSNGGHSCKEELIEKTNDVIVHQPISTTENDSLQNSANNRDIQNANVSSNQNDENKRDSSDLVIVKLSDNQLDPRINAIKNLENTIKTFLVQIHGSIYINDARFDSPEEINYRSRNVANETGFSRGSIYVAYHRVFADPCLWCCACSNNFCSNDYCIADCLLCGGFCGECLALTTVTC